MVGQHYTTNYRYILSNMSIPSTVGHIIEPFVGRGDLLEFIDRPVEIEAYDIDPKTPVGKCRDVLTNPPSYSGKFVLTNPPFLAKNKSKDKGVFNRYHTDDLYKCFLKQIISDPVIGGIIIIPVNFLSSTRREDIVLRSNFMGLYLPVKINIFEEQVFPSTTTSVCAIQFEPRNTNTTTDVHFYPDGQQMRVVLKRELDYLIGGEIYRLPTSVYRVQRIVEGVEPNTCIAVKCLDDIRALLVDESARNKYIDTTPNHTNRMYMLLNITPPVNLDVQQRLVDEFNRTLEYYRRKYHSMFLTNYREKSRKRISFQLVYRLMSHILGQIV